MRYIGDNIILHGCSTNLAFIKFILDGCRCTKMENDIN